MDVVHTQRKFALNMQQKSKKKVVTVSVPEQKKKKNGDHDNNDSRSSTSRTCTSSNKNSTTTTSGSLFQRLQQQHRNNNNTTATTRARRRHKSAPPSLMLNKQQQTTGLRRRRRRRRLLEDHYRVEGTGDDDDDNNTIVTTTTTTRIANKDGTTGDESNSCNGTMEDHHEESNVDRKNQQDAHGRNNANHNNNNNNNGSRNRNRNNKHPVVLPGLPKYEEDWARDSHDFFNLVVLIPVVYLNLINWDMNKVLILLQQNTMNNLIIPVTTAFNMIVITIGQMMNQASGLTGLLLLETTTSQSAITTNHSAAVMGGGGSGSTEVDYSITTLTMEDAWNGDYFNLFFTVTVLYFIVDLLWVCIIPQCVKSPTTILQHHVATLLYLYIPYQHISYRYCMGACMIVEINTWFLIARRVFNKQGLSPWTTIFAIPSGYHSKYFSIRIKFISIMFYLTWISIRCILYPALMRPIYHLYVQHSQDIASYYNVVAIAVPLHASFCLLNIKWSYDLLMSKIRYWRRIYKSRRTISTRQHPPPSHNNRNNHHHQHYYHYDKDHSESGGISKGL